MQILHLTRYETILRDDIRDQLILDCADLVPQGQLALLQPGDLQLIGGPGIGQSIDRDIEITMLDPQMLQSLAQFGIGHGFSEILLMERSEARSRFAAESTLPTA